MRTRWIGSGVALVSIGACFVDHPPAATAADGATDSDATTTGDDTVGATGGRDGTVGPNATTGSSGPAQTMGPADTAPDDGTTDDADTSDASSSTTGPGVDPCADPSGHIVYIDIDGAELELGIVENAPNNVTAIPQQVGLWPAYAHDDAEEILALVREDFSGYNICITIEPPAADDYDVILLQSEAHLRQPNTVSFLQSDCGNMIHNEVELLFVADDFNLPSATKAVAISKHIARRLGLDDVAKAPHDLMHRFVAETLNGATFTDRCLGLHTMATCGGTGGCDATQQNAHAVLLAELGGA